MSSQPIVDLVAPLEYFHTQITQATNDLNIGLDTRLEFYLVNLLCEFINTSKLKNNINDIDILNTPLAIMLKKALEADTSRQVKIYKSMGDVSLYFCGYFSDYFNRKTFDSDYYMAMGSIAFSKVANIMRHTHNDEEFGNLYDVLATEFKQLVLIVSRVSEQDKFNIKDEKWILDNLFKFSG